MAVDFGLITSVIEAVKDSLELGKLILVKNKDVRDAFKQKDVLDKIRKTENNGNIVVIQVNGNNNFIADWSKIPHDKKTLLLENFSKEKKISTKKEINIINQDFYPRVEKFENSQSSDRKIEKIFPFLASDFKNILKLSIYVKELYDEGNSREASSVKIDIGYQYGKDGRKLCNLYSNGYIIAMIDFLYAYHDGDEEKIKEEINKRIFELIRKPIFYIHQRHQNLVVINQIYQALYHKEIYIAIHVAGQNINKAETIVSEVTETAKENNYDIGVSNEKTLSQTPVYNAFITPKK